MSPTSLSWRTVLLYACVALLAFAAIGLTAARLLLYAGDYRGLMEIRISELLGQPVRIGAMDARLHGFSPTLLLRDVSLLDSTGSQPIADFSEIRVSLSPLASLAKLAPVLREITVVGASLDVERRADGSFHVAGLAANDPKSGDPEAVGRWLLGRHRLVLRDARVAWHDRIHQRQFQFEGVSVEVRNDGRRHQLTGSLRLPSQWGGRSAVAVDMEGDPLAAGGARGRIYLKAERLRPAGLLGELPVKGIHARGGNLSLELWGEWDGARLHGMEGRFHGEQLLFSGPQKGVLRFSRLSGRAKWARSAEGWRLDVADLMVARGGRLWEPARIRVDLEHSLTDPQGRRYRLQASFLRVDDMAAIAALIPAESGWRREIDEMALRGDLRQVHVDYSTSGEIVARAAFNDLGIHAKGGRFSGLDGEFHYAEGRVALSLSTRDGTLVLPALFREPLVLDSLDGDALLRRDGAGWLVNAREVEFANRDIHAQADLRIRLPDQGAPFLDLRGAFQRGRIESIPRYLPAKIMPEQAVGWLDSAFKGGEIVSGGFLFHGRTSDFPFDGHQGRFEVHLNAREVELDYHPGWPRLSGIRGEVVFDGGSMEVNAEAAKLMGGQISATRVSVDDLRHARLHVKGHAEGALGQLFSYLRVTGLAGRFSPTLDRFRAGGGYGLELDFEHPLSSGPAGAVAGVVTFRDSRLAVAPGLDFTGVNGALRFEQSRYWSEKIDGKLSGEPMEIRVSPSSKVDPAQTRVALNGSVDDAALRRLTGLPWLSRIRGRTGFDAQLLLAHAEQGETLLRVRSRLEGMSIDLPSPFAKSVEEKRDLDLGIRIGGPRKGEVEMTLSRGFAATFALTPGGDLSRAALHFGDRLPSLPEGEQIRVTGRLPAVAPAAWGEVLAAWRGSTSLPRHATPLPVFIDMKELGIVPRGNGARKMPDGVLSSDRIPRLTVRIDRLFYDKLFLGSLSFHTAEVPSQIQLRDLRLASPTYTLTGKGAWDTGSTPRVRLTLAATGRDFGAAARGLAIASVMNKGDFRFEGEFAWPGNPLLVTASRLEGSLKVRVRDGVLEEVSPGAGRLLGLLSLQALPRRLTLDFSDLFEKGMRFRKLDGSFTLKDGNAITDNLRMEALPAVITIKGRTGFVRRDFDQTITVIPDVAGNLPLAGGLALGPQVGAALLLLQQLFHKNIDEAAKVTYALTGSWEQPSLKRAEDHR